MNSTTLIAVVPVAGSILTAALSYFFAKRQQLGAQWRDSKLNHYKVLLAAISDLAVDNADQDAHNRFALAVNTIALVAHNAWLTRCLTSTTELGIPAPTAQTVHMIAC